MEEIDLANIHMVKKIFKSFKYFVGYITNHIKLLPIKLPQMNGYLRYFDSNNKCMNHDEKLLKNTTKYGIRLIIY